MFVNQPGNLKDPNACGDNHKIKNVAIGTCGGVVDTDQGKVIVILHEHAILGKGQTIHSSGQMEHHRNIVRDSGRVEWGITIKLNIQHIF